MIITLAARYKLPAVYWERFFVAGGGLISYGSNFVDAFPVASPATSIESSRARRLPICRCRRRPNTNWLSISRLLRRSASTCR